MPENKHSQIDLSDLRVAYRILESVTAKDGLLWHNGEVVPLPMADKVSWVAGFFCAEQLVRALNKGWRFESGERENKDVDRR